MMKKREVMDSFDKGQRKSKVPKLSAALSSKTLSIGTSRLSTNVDTASKIKASTTEKLETTSTGVKASSEVDTTKSEIVPKYEAIHQNDIGRLAEGRWLNDTIINFWLRYTHNELMTPVDRERTYIFDTLFFQTLTNPEIDDGTTKTPSEKRHDRVKGWTKDVDIFEKDFLIIPINDRKHWFLAVICFPGLEGVHDIGTGELIENYQEPARKKFAKSDNKTETKSNGNVNDIPNGVAVQSPSTSADIADQDGTEKPLVKRACIFGFDSFVRGGDSRSRVFSTLREYLDIESKTRTGKNRNFTKNSMPGRMLSVPQQPNTYDCGVYLLLYTEWFFQYPIKSFDVSSDDGMIWWNRTFSGKRKAIEELIKKKFWGQ